MVLVNIAAVIQNLKFILSTDYIKLLCQSLIYIYIYIYIYIHYAVINNLSRIYIYIYI